MPLLLNGIVMWSGALNEIPNGWSLCDGTNGTPDLQNSFIIGAGSTYSFGDSGGSVNTILAAHSHTVSGTTAANSVSHGHAVTYAAIAGGTYSNYRRGSFTNITTSANGAHGHSLAISTAGSGETGVGKNLPPYYALAFIMQTS